PDARARPAAFPPKPPRDARPRRARTAPRSSASGPRCAGRRTAPAPRLRFPPAQPVAELLPGGLDALAGLLEEVAEAIGVERDRVAGLLPGVDLLVAGHVLPVHDPIPVSTLHPAHQLRHAADGERVRRPQPEEEAAAAV